MGASSTPNPFFFGANDSTTSMKDEWEVYYDNTSNNEFKVYIDLKNSTTGYTLQYMSYTIIVSKYEEFE